MEIGSAPKNGELIILHDAAAGSWEVGRWGDESHCWIGLDGRAVQFVPTRWAPVAGTTASQDESGPGFFAGMLKQTVFVATRFPLFNLFVLAFSEEKHGTRPPRDERSRLFSVAFSVAMLVAAVYATSGFRVADIWPVRMLDLGRVAMWIEHPRRDDAPARDLAAARAEIKLHVRQAEVAQKELGEMHRMADATQAELRQARRAAAAKQVELTRQLDEKTAQANKLAQDLAAEQNAAKRRFDEAREETLRRNRIDEIRDNEFRKALAEAMTRADEFEREGRVAREQLAEVTAAARRAADDAKAKAASDAAALADRDRKAAVSAEKAAIAATGSADRREPVPAQMVDRQDSPSGQASLSSPAPVSNAITEDRTRGSSAADAKAGGNTQPDQAPTASVTIAPPSAESLPAKVGNVEVSPTAPAANAPVATNPSADAALLAGPMLNNPARPAAQVELAPLMSMSPAEEARLLGRAEFLMQQADFAGARLLLEHGIEKGSAKAIVLLGETYDELAIHQPYGIKSDPEKARQLYELALAFGVEAARERLTALSNTKR